MSLIVQKFGGTSLGTAERLQQVSQIIRNTQKNHSVIVVVSAISAQTKAEGTTSRLLAAGQNAIEGEDTSHILSLIEQTHIDIISESIQSLEVRTQLRQQIHLELKSLRRFLEAVQVIREVSIRSQDVIIGTGERLSAILLAGILQDQGVNAVYTNFSEVVPKGCTLKQSDFYQKVQKSMAETLPKHKGCVPIVTGFFGLVPGGLIEGIGRGYSDLTAALIAAELKAKSLEVWKEVDGIFTADPNRVPNARVLSTLSPAEAAELTYFGSQVLHPFTMEQAINAKIPVHIRNTFAPQKPGTVIEPDGKAPKGSTAVAVTSKSDISIINIQSNRMLNASGFMAKVFDIFRAHNLIIDLVSTSEVSVSCSTECKTGLKPMLRELEVLGDVTFEKQRAIVSLVGQNMRYMTGTAARMFNTLADSNINIEMITQGASEINISCVIPQENADTALRMIHHEFLE